MPDTLFDLEDPTTPLGEESMTLAAARDWLAEINASPEGTGFFPAPWVRREVERITGRPVDEHYIRDDGRGRLRVVVQRLVATLARTSSEVCEVLT